MNEVIVTLKSEDRKYTQHFLVYENFMANQDDPLIQKCIREAKTSFEGDPDNIKIKIILEVI